MKRRKLLPMSKDDLEKLTTERLLARLRQLQRCEESLALSDQNIGEYKSSGLIEFKVSSVWTNEYKKMKDILNQREHISSKKN